MERPQKSGLRSRLSGKLSYANVASTLALVLALGTGGAYAASRYLITSTKQIKPSVLSQLRGATGATGATGPAGPAGALGPAGAAGPAGATGLTGTAAAYGYVSPTGVVSDAHGNLIVTNPSTGVYFITVPGVSPNTAAMIAAPDYAGDSTVFGAGSTSTQTIVEALSDAPNCSASQFEVRTGQRQETLSSGSIVAVQNVAVAEPFIFMVA